MKNELNLDEIKAKLELKVSPEFRAFLLDEISKREALLKTISPQDPQFGTIRGQLTRMYLNLNYQLGMVCCELNYPLNQCEWPDCKPLETIAKIYQGLQATDWYQYHLDETKVQSKHLWTKISTYEPRPSSTSQPDSAKS